MDHLNKGKNSESKKILPPVFEIGELKCNDLLAWVNI
jgi:hypothetical protein